MKENSINLLFCINRKVLGIFVCCLKSIALHGGYEHYHVYVLHSDFEQSMAAAIGTDFQKNMTFHFIQTQDTMFDGFPETARYPREIYYRLAAPLLLPENLDRILYLDADTVVINSLRELYETDFEENLYVGCTHIRKFLTKFNRARLKSEKAEAYLNTGVLMMNLPSLREELRMEEIAQYVHQQGHAFILPDQDILAALYGDRVKQVDTMKFNLSDKILRIYNANHKNAPIDLQWIRENSVIIHYCGKNKPWNSDYIGELDIFYRELFQ